MQEFMTNHHIALPDMVS